MVDNRTLEYKRWDMLYKNKEFSSTKSILDAIDDLIVLSYEARERVKFLLLSMRDLTKRKMIEEILEILDNLKYALSIGDLEEIDFNEEIKDYEDKLKELSYK